MNPDDISINDLSKNFEYYKSASEIDSIDSLEDLKLIAKSYCKLYYAQQEAIMNLADINL